VGIKNQQKKILGGNMDTKDLEKAMIEHVENSSKDVKQEFEDLRKENLELKKTLWEYGIEEVSHISDEEFICLSEINKLKKISENDNLSEQEVRMFDLLNKNLRIIRGQTEKKAPKGKKMSKADLLKIVDGGKREH